MKFLLFLICFLYAGIAFAEDDCKVVEYPDHTEVVCSGKPSDNTVPGSINQNGDKNASKEIDKKKIFDILSQCNNALTQADAGTSLKNYSKYIFEINANTNRVLNDDTIKKYNDFETLKKHLTNINKLLASIGSLWKMQEQDGVKLLEMDKNHSVFGLQCTPIKNNACSIAGLKIVAIEKVNDEINIVMKGLDEGFSQLQAK